MTDQRTKARGSPGSTLTGPDYHPPRQRKDDILEFSDVLKKRRSCRKFTAATVPPTVMEKALSEALLAPNSSNLQLWRFFWVTSAPLKKALAEACLSQSAATTAQEFVVVVADWSLWKENRQRMIQTLKAQGAHEGVLRYYVKLIPMVYTYGFFSVLGYLKKILTFFIGFFRPILRGPHTQTEAATVAVKSAALACQNLMLSIYNQGYACCPMEGFDEVRVKKVIQNKSRASSIVMVISVGQMDPQGIYGDQIRFDPTLALRKL